MRIKRLKLSNFRNHKEFEVSFKKTNLLLGANGTGKTGILESICLVSTSKSPRTTKISDLIHYKKNKTLVELDLFDQNNNPKTIRLLLNRSNNGKNKTFSFDGFVVEPKEVVGFFKTVYFSPETLEIINGSPAERRRFVDILISQIDPNYLQNLIEYKKVLMNRNRLLKLISSRKSDREELVFWDDRLVEYGSRIIDKRREVISKITPQLDKHYRAIANTRKGKIEAVYRPSFVVEQNQGSVEKAFTERLSMEIDFEIKYGSTIYGPHRDEISFFYNGHNASSFCSRGEIRSIVIALKMAEAYFIKQESGDEPVVLLDDIYSELDKIRAQFLSKMIIDNFQTIISSTENEIVDNFAKDSLKIIELRQKQAVYV